MASTGDSPASKQGRTGGTSPDNMTATPPSTTSEVRALEFYCGVGGLHYSLLRARSRHTQESTKVVGAFDINPNANDTYEHNFGVRPCANSLYAVPPAKFDKLNANLWLMSPPCQPFTRQGHQKDVNDGRSQSFLRLIDILPELKNKPDHLLVENVVGFEVSEVRKALLKALRTNGYTCREFILSPRMFGVPYSRPRYFCVAKRVGLRWKKICDEDGGQRGVTDSKVSGNEVDGRDLKQHCLEESEMKESHREAGCDDDIHSVIHRVPPPSCLSDPTHWVPAGFLHDLESTDPTEATVARQKREAGQSAETAAKVSKAKARENENENENDTKNKKTYGVATLAGFLESSPKRKSASKQCDAGFGKRPEAAPDLYSAYAVPLPELKKAKKSIHAVTQTDRKCNCFTKSYGKFVKGTGSFLVEGRFDFHDWDLGDLNATDLSTGDTTGAIPVPSPDPPRARYFTPREVANIHSFPPNFSFPKNITQTQQFALLGNSLSVACVAPLLEFLLDDV